MILPLADREVRGYVCNTTLPKGQGGAGGGRGRAAGKPAGGARAGAGQKK